MVLRVLALFAHVLFRTVSGTVVAPGMIMKQSISNHRAKTVVFAFVALTCIAAATGPGAVGSQRKRSTSSQTPVASESARRVYVRSKSLLVRAAVVEDKLLKRPEFKQLGLSITRDESDADIILELRHDLLTMYVFTVVEVKTQTVIAGGKLSSLGGTVADKVAKRFVKAMSGVNQP